METISPWNTVQSELQSSDSEPPWLGTALQKKSHLLEDGTEAISEEYQLRLHEKLLKPNCHLLLRQRQNGKRKSNRAEGKKEEYVHVRQEGHTMETCKRVKYKPRTVTVSIC